MDHLGNTTPYFSNPSLEEASAVEDQEITNSEQPQEKEHSNKKTTGFGQGMRKALVAHYVIPSLIRPFVMNLLQIPFLNTQSLKDIPPEYLGLYAITHPEVLQTKKLSSQYEESFQKYQHLSLYTEIQQQMPFLLKEFHSLVKDSAILFPGDTPLSRSLRIVLGYLGASVLMGAKIAQCIVNRCYINVTIRIITAHKNKILFKEKNKGAQKAAQDKTKLKLEPTQEPLKQKDNSSGKALTKLETFVDTQVRDLISAAGPWVFISVFLKGFIHLARCNTTLTLVLSQEHCSYISKKLTDALSVLPPAKGATTKVFKYILHMASWKIQLIILFVMNAIVPPAISILGTSLLITEMLAMYQHPQKEEEMEETQTEPIEAQ